MHVGEGGSGVLLGGACPPDHRTEGQVNPGYVDVHEDANTLRSLLFDHAVY